MGSQSRAGAGEVSAQLSQIPSQPMCFFKNQNQMDSSVNLEMISNTFF